MSQLFKKIYLIEIQTQKMGISSGFDLSSRGGGAISFWSKNLP